MLYLPKLKPWMKPIYDAVDLLQELDRRSARRRLPPDLLEAKEIDIAAQISQFTECRLAVSVFRISRKSDVTGHNGRETPIRPHVPALNPASGHPAMLNVSTTPMNVSFRNPQKENRRQQLNALSKLQLTGLILDYELILTEDSDPIEVVLNHEFAGTTTGASPRRMFS